MCAAGQVPSVEHMNTITKLQWPLILGLGALALVRPLIRTVEDQLGAGGLPAGPVIVTGVITAIWVLVVGLTRTAHPVLTLLFTGLAYAAFAILLSGILSPMLTGELQGPLATPLAIIPMLATNALWGLAAGALALVVQRLRGVRPGRAAPR